MKVITCPFCGYRFTENCEYVDIGVGMQQVTANYCPACGAEEIGLRADSLMSETMAVKHSWMRDATLGPVEHIEDKVRAAGRDEYRAGGICVMCDPRVVDAVLEFLRTGPPDQPWPSNVRMTGFGGIRIEYAWPAPKVDGTDDKVELELEFEHNGNRVGFRVWPACDDAKAHDDSTKGTMSAKNTTALTRLFGIASAMASDRRRKRTKKA